MAQRLFADKDAGLARALPVVYGADGHQPPLLIDGDLVLPRRLLRVARARPGTLFLARGPSTRSIALRGGLGLEGAVGCGGGEPTLHLMEHVAALDHLHLPALVLCAAAVAARGPGARGVGGRPPHREEARDSDGEGVRHMQERVLVLYVRIRPWVKPAANAALILRVLRMHSTIIHRPPPPPAAATSLGLVGEAAASEGVRLNKMA
mmetsp:Transcript_116482/g.370508  ORF Transcript_116482/g.370508 Transcript_116482/m.370508 type:complete len:207 (-) Transcript_116482:3-623(-)